MNIQFAYQAHIDTLPTISEQLSQMWQVAALLDSLGMPLDDWCPPADTPANARRNLAFEKTGPSEAAIAIFKEEERSNRAADFRDLAVWNGKEDKGGATIGYTLQAGENGPNSSFELRSKAIDALDNKENLINLIKGMLAIWDAPYIEVSPAPYRTRHKVFDDRPGVGWMLYLPEIFTPAQLPEAPELVRVEGPDGRSRGTIIVSISDDLFSNKNAEHVAAANAIEIRLADMDLLPRFSTL